MSQIKYVNAFTRSLYSILKDYLGINSRRGQIELKSKTSPIQGVAVLVGVTGDVDGKVILDMKQEVGHRLTSKFNEEYNSEINDMFISTLKEFGNVVCGNAMTTLEGDSLDCDITTPTIIIGEHMALAEESTTQIIMIPFITDVGQIDINVVMEKI